MSKLIDVTYPNYLNKKCICLIVIHGTTITLSDNFDVASVKHILCCPIS